MSKDLRLDVDLGTELVGGPIEQAPPELLVSEGTRSQVRCEGGTCSVSLGQIYWAHSTCAILG